MQSMRTVSTNYAKYVHSVYKPHTVSTNYAKYAHSVYKLCKVCAQCLQTTHRAYRLCTVSTDYTCTCIRVYARIRTYLYTSVQMTPYKGCFGPSDTAAQFGTFLLCQILPFQISPLPNFPAPVPTNTDGDTKTPLQTTSRSHAGLRAERGSSTALRRPTAKRPAAAHPPRLPEARSPRDRDGPEEAPRGANTARRGLREG